MKSKVTRNMTSLFLTAVMCAGMLGGAVNAQEPALLSAANLNNPVIVEDPDMIADQKVTWDCVWFGSYPQAEVVPSAEDYIGVAESMMKDGDIIVDSSLYDELQKTNGWGENNDIEINGNKYRRMRHSDATFATTPVTETTGKSSKRYCWSDNTSYHYFKYEPIKWKVLRVNENQAFLLSEVALDCQKYNNDLTVSNSPIEWKISTIRSWLNGYMASENLLKEDFSSKNFINSAFTMDERMAITDTIMTSNDSDNIETKESDTTDKVFLLSEAETNGTDAKIHGFALSEDVRDEARRSRTSTYAKAMGVSSLQEGPYIGNCFWWLRSGGTKSDEKVMWVRFDGFVSLEGDWPNCCYGVRPALNLDLSSNLYSYAGTVCSDGTENEISPGGQTEPGEENIPVTDISLSENKLQLKVGNKSKIAASVFPDNATEKAVLWSSSDKSVVEVDTEGMVTAKAAGKCTVQCTSVSNSEISKSAEIEVLAEQTGSQEPGDNTDTDKDTNTDADSNTGSDIGDNTNNNVGGNANTNTGTSGDTSAGANKSIKVSRIALSGISKKIAAGKKIKLTASIIPSNASDKSVTWTSGNKKVATVNSSGVVTMKKNSGGKSVTITAAAKDGSGVKATYKITSMKGAVKRITVSGKKSVKAGKTLKLQAKVSAAKKANKKVKWTSSNKKYATVSSSGKVKALKAGKGKKVKITAMATDGSGKKKTVVIKIK